MAKEIALQDLQNRLLEALTQFDRIAKTADVPYSLMCGTLLGAVRHQGFIPWDDDVDVVMFREDFIRFKACWESQKETFLPAYLDETDTWVPRIRIDRSKDVFVDIFILDRQAGSAPVQKFNVFRLKLLQGMMKKDIHYGTYSFLGKVLVFVTHLMGLPFSFERKYRWYHKIAMKYDQTQNPAYYIADGAFSVTGMSWSREQFAAMQETPFAGKSFEITENYKSVLVQLYGDTYMQLPPEKDRVPKHHYEA